MTTYKKYSIKNRKTRKIKLFKGGVPMEDDIKQVAIETVQNSITAKTGYNPLEEIKKVAIEKVEESVSNGGIDGSIKNTAIEKVKESLTVKPGGKQVSIFIDFYKKLLKPDDYGQKLDNFNKFYEIVNINKNGINMTESVTGVEELLKIFNNELKYIKATDADKENKKKALLSNREKRKAIIIDYGDNGDFNINGEKGLVAPGPGTSTPALVSSSIVPATSSGTGPEDSIKETAINTVVSTINTINIIQDAAKNTVVSTINTINNIQDAAINKLKVETGSISDTELKNLRHNIKNEKTELNKLNSRLIGAETDLKRQQSKLETAKRNRKTEQNINRQYEISKEIGSINTKIKELNENIKEINKNKNENEIKIDNLSMKKNNLLKLLEEKFKNLTETLENSGIKRNSIGYNIDDKLKGKISKIKENIIILQ